MGNDVMDMVRSADPVDPAAVRGWAASDEGQRVLLRTMAASRPPARPPLRSRPRLRLVPMGAAAIALAVAFGSGFLPVGRGAEPASAVETLRSAGTIAADRPATPHDGDYRYTRSEVANLLTTGKDGRGYAAMVPLVREMWVARDGSGRIREEIGEPVFLTSRDRAAWEADGSPALAGGDSLDETVAAGTLRYEDYAGLSTDPDELYEQLERRAEETSSSPVPQGAPIPDEMFVIVGDLLRETIAPPDLRAALYEVAARIPGVELVGEVTDPAGREGVAVAVTDEHEGLRRELIFDPDTSELIATRHVLVDEVAWVDAGPGAVVHWAAHLESDTVGSTSERPA